MSDNTKFGLALSLLLVGLLFLLFITSERVHAAEEKEVKPARPKEVVIEEKYQKELPKLKKLDCSPTYDIFHTPSCLYI